MNKTAAFAFLSRGGTVFGAGTMIGKEYLARQAATLLKLAQITRSTATAAALASKAADLQDKAAELPAPDNSAASEAGRQG